MKTARADVTPIRQRTQFSCMAASLSMCLGAQGMEMDEDTVNRVMGAKPMKGASWEQAIAAAQHFGMRATLVSPCSFSQLKEWTDRGVGVMIAWNPEGRDWSHASVVFDVDGEGNVHVADPNIPDPEETVRVIPRAEFLKKWFEKWPDYLVRRPALAIEREITIDGRQVQASLNSPLRTRRDYGNPPSQESLMSLISTNAFSEALKGAKFEKGKPADPTKNMSPEDAKEWKRQNEENADNFKSAATPTTPMMAVKWVSDMADRIAMLLTEKYGIPPAKRIDANLAKVQKQLSQYSSSSPLLLPIANLESKLYWVSFSLSTDLTQVQVQIMPKGPAKGPTKQWLIPLNSASGDALEWKFQSDAGNNLGRLASSIEEFASLLRSASKEDSKEGKFEKGKPADPTKNMSPEDAKEWDENTEEHKDKFKSAAEEPFEVAYQIRGEGWKRKTFKSQAQYEKWYDKMDEEKGIAEVRFQEKAAAFENAYAKCASIEEFASLLRSASVEEDSKEGKFEKGKPADPTKNMSPEDAKEWEEQKDENKDNFKSAAGLKLGPVSTMERMALLSAFQVLSTGQPSAFGISRKTALQTIRDITHRALPEDAKPPVRKSLDEYLEWVWDQGDTSGPSPKTASETEKTAASGLYGFTKEAERVCGSATTRLSKFATKLAKEIYTKDGETPAFLEEHSKRTGSRAARMLRAVMSDIGPGKPEKTAARREGGRYGFSAKTSRLALQACLDLEAEAGSIAHDLNSRMGSKHSSITAFFAKHAKKAKCGWSEMIAEAYPPAPASVTASLSPRVSEILLWDGTGERSSRSANSFLVADEDEDEGEEKTAASEVIQWKPAKNEDEAEWQEMMDAKAKKGTLTEKDREKILHRGGKFQD